MMNGDPPTSGCGPILSDRSRTRGRPEHHHSTPTADPRPRPRHSANALRDADHDGWFAAAVDGVPTVTTKQAYGHAFVVLAASSAAAAGIEGADALLADALRVSAERFWDESEGQRE